MFFCAGVLSDVVRWVFCWLRACVLLGRCLEWCRWLAASVVGVEKALRCQLSQFLPQSVFFFFFFFFVFSFFVMFAPLIFYFIFIFIFIFFFFSFSFFLFIFLLWGLYFWFFFFFNITYQDIRTGAYTGKVHTWKVTDKDYTETCIQGLHENRHTRATQKHRQGQTYIQWLIHTMTETIQQYNTVHTMTETKAKRTEQ